jgi:hypothetical protein
MTTGFKQMHFSVPGGVFILQWPDGITPEWLEFAREALEIQMRSIERHAKQLAEKRVEAGVAEYQSWSNAPK